MPGRRRTESPESAARLSQLKRQRSIEQPPIDSNIHEMSKQELLIYASQLRSYIRVSILNNTDPGGCQGAFREADALDSQAGTASAEAFDEADALSSQTGTAPAEFSVMLERSRTDIPWGCHILIAADEMIHIENIGDGLMAAWNANNPASAVQVGDCIVSVNGALGTDKMLIQLQEMLIADMVAVREHPQETPAASVAADIAAVRRDPEVTPAASADPGHPKDVGEKYFRVLKPPHLSLNLKVGSTYSMRELEVRCGSDPGKLTQLSERLAQPSLFYPMSIVAETDAASGKTSPTTAKAAAKTRAKVGVRSRSRRLPFHEDPAGRFGFGQKK